MANVKISFPPATAADIRQELANILQHPEFSGSKRFQDFLSFIVEETLAGRGENIKAYTIATAVLGRSSSFDPQIDPIVRVEGARLRIKLGIYYADNTRKSKIKIELPKGGYRPDFYYLNADDPSADPSGDHSDNHSGDHSGNTPTRQEPTTHVKPSIVVLPFVNLNNEPSEIDYLAHGFAEEISIGLSHFEDLTIISAPYPDPTTISPGPPWDIAKSLQARFILYGSTQTIGGVLRIRVSLIDAETKSSLWADKFDHNYTADALFEILDKITTQVVTQVGDSFGRINRFLSQEGGRKRTSELKVYEAVLHYHYWLTNLSMENGLKAEKALSHAIDLDPSYALPYALLSDVYSVNYQWGRELSPTFLDKSMALAVKSLDLDAECQYAQWSVAFNYFLRGDGEQFRLFAKEALRINPYNTNVVVGVGLKTCMIGSWEEGLALVDRGSRLNLCLPGWFHVAKILRHFLDEDFAAALSKAKLVTTPDFMCGPLLRSAIYGKMGMIAEAELELNEVLRLCPAFVENSEKLLVRLFFKPEHGEQIMDGLLLAGL